MSETTFGSSAIATPANAITVARILITPVLLVMILGAEDTAGASWPGFVLGFVLSMSDAVDGQLARKQGPTRSGAFLDPLADKFLVLGTLFSLVAIGRFPLLPVVIITVREVGISVYRSYWARKGFAIPAASLGKWKTTVQIWASAAAMLPWLADDPSWPADGLLAIAVVLTVVSGIQYLTAGRQAMTTEGQLH